MLSYDVQVSQKRSIPVAVVRRQARPSEFPTLVPEYCGVARPSWEVYGHCQSEWNNDPSRIRTDVFYLLMPDAPSADSAAPGAGGEPAT